MREYPVFVPYGQEHLAALITLPEEEEPRGLVLLLTGTGAPRSHRFQVWTRASRALAELGIASVRMDYLGLGDSTGLVENITMDSLALQEAMTVFAFAKRAVGVREVGVAGNCTGSRLGLEVAASTPECVAGVCLLTRVLQPSGVNRMVIQARRSKYAAIIRSSPLLRRLAEPLRGRRGKVSSRVNSSFEKALEHSRMLFVYTPQDTDSYNEKAMAKLDEMVAVLSGEQRARFERRIVPGGPMAGFESLEIQEVAVSLLVEWMDASFSGRKRLPHPRVQERAAAR